LRIALSAPALGTAAVVIPLFMLSDLGVPLREAGPPVLITLFTSAVAMLVWRRPAIPRAVLPVTLIALVHLVLSGRPMVRFGFHWLANANGDMSYYVLSATSLLTSGLRHPVDRVALAHRHDFATVAHQLHELGVRVGADVVLASLAATTGRLATDVYMPLILSVSMVGICAAGSLAMQFATRARAAIFAAAFLAVSPLATYGVVQQLLPQVWGLALATALFALLMRPELHARDRPPLRQIVPVWILAVALFLVYTELAASLVIAYGMYLAFLARRRQLSLAGIARLWLPTAVALGIVANAYLPRMIGFLTSSARNGVDAGTRFGGVQLFGRSLVPIALPAIVGLQNLFAPLSTPFMTGSILVAMAVLVVTLTAAVITAREGIAACIVIAGDLTLGVLLGFEKSDFGLFKLYMYVQPFLGAAAAVWIARARAKPIVFGLVAVAALLIAAQIRTQASYVSQSFNPTDLRNASDADLLPAFRSLLADAKFPVLSVTDNVPLTELEGAAASVQPHPLGFLAGNPFGLPATTHRLRLGGSGLERVTFDQSRQALDFLAGGRCELAMSSGSQSVLNRHQLPEGMPDLVPITCRKAHDLLAFVVSSVGQAFYSRHKDRVSFWQLEGDPAFPRRTMSGLGRYALLQAINSTPGVRLELDFSTSSLRDPSLSFRLPPAAVIGSHRFELPVTGAGSARVFSPPLRPQEIGGQSYLLLDMGERGYFPPVRRVGLTGLWGGSVQLDPRMLTSYVRNVSLVSSREYRSMSPPASVSRFPHDLGNENFEYSGIFEDGWIGRDAYAVLAPMRASQFVLRADVVPASRQHLTVTINGNRVWSEPVSPGALVVRVPMARHTGREVVRLHWSVANRLSPRDPRPAPARLRFLGFAPLPVALAHLPGDLAAPGVQADGVFADGWLAQRAAIVLAGRAGKLVLQADVPPTPDGRQSVHVTIDGRVIASRPVRPGAFDLRVHVPATPSAHTVRITWSEAPSLGPNDPRHAAARLTYLGVVETAAPRHVAIPADLRRRDLSVSGIFPDGWAKRRAAIVLAGGPAATLWVATQTTLPRQRVGVYVDGRLISLQDVPIGGATFRLTLPATSSPRHVQLRFARTAPIAPDDPRRAAALLKSFSVTNAPAR
jgi:hypothetical protein